MPPRRNARFLLRIVCSMLRFYARFLLFPKSVAVGATLFGSPMWILPQIGTTFFLGLIENQSFALMVGFPSFPNNAVVGTALSGSPVRLCRYLFRQIARFVVRKPSPCLAAAPLSQKVSRLARHFPGALCGFAACELSRTDRVVRPCGCGVPYGF